MTYYISGPMSGLPNLNRHAFTMAASLLYTHGHETISPFNLPSGAPDTDTYRKQLKRDLVAICGKADALYMLEGWEQSPGACAEHAVAVAVALPIVYEGGI